MEESLKYKFKDKSLLETALTHSSYANEAKGSNVKYNERLEFLGDAILGFVVGSFIFKEYPDTPEGELTKLRASVVCEAMLSKKARLLNVGEHMRLGKGEENTGGRDRNSILADAFEAIIGAIYIDGGIDEASKFVLTQLKDSIFEMKNSVKILDSKTSLQEILQKDSNAAIEYTIVGESGPAHDKEFKVEVKNKGEVLGVGCGKSKKEAEQNAAMIAIKNL